MTARPGEWLLIGLPGGNPLGFLAAVGTLRTATLAWPEARPTMAWRAEGGAWHPVLQVPGLGDTERLIDGLGEQLERMRNHPALEIGNDLKFEPEAFRKLAQQAQQSSASDRRYSDFMASFASEAVTDKTGEQIADTAFRTMSGAGHQHFLLTMRELVAKTTREQLAQALLEPWKYSDEGLSLRWDPADDRRYALRWAEPSGDPTRTVQAASRLAIEALPLFPTVPVRRRLETVGFSQERGRGVFLTWPIWEPAIDVDTVRSLLSMRELQEDSPSRGPLAARGICDVYRSQRITQGKFRNFAAAMPV